MTGWGLGVRSSRSRPPHPVSLKQDDRDRSGGLPAAAACPRPASPRFDRHLGRGGSVGANDRARVLSPWTAHLPERRQQERHHRGDRALDAAQGRRPPDASHVAETSTTRLPAFPIRKRARTRGSGGAGDTLGELGKRRRRRHHHHPRRRREHDPVVREPREAGGVVSCSRRFWALRPFTRSNPATLSWPRLHAAAPPRRRH
jgi:hypothetical protein